ncbi:polygalacturonase-like [Cucurbita maxima]|uniref:Polygalacturonase-like n=1 Tax=Cucurbita maxima TaxID=3661 RepID=A0A6J1JI71_CUCMA|nr:polygalacturonase-like [Cucurbita maxima]
MAKFSNHSSRPSPFQPFIVILVVVFFLFHTITTSHSATLLNVLDFGAIRGGGRDSSPAFRRAWAKACTSSESTIVYVPKGRFLVRPIEFHGGCGNNDISFHIDGALVAPSDYRILGDVGSWLSFDGVDGVSLSGGVLDANGAALWNCKSSAAHCPVGAMTLNFRNSNNIRIRGMMSKNSQLFHILIDGCKNVLMEGVNIVAPSHSPNTDGIHIETSTHVTIVNSIIQTGDDCISIGPGSRNLWIQRIRCGPGHGISIGSLAHNKNEPGVRNVTVSNAIFSGTQNGLRIKSWARPSSGFVYGVQFLGATMHNVQNPILIDQHYCPHNLNCPGQESGIKISNIIYKDIVGTSATPIAIKFDCSSRNPCNGIRLEDVRLTYQNEVAKSSCEYANGKALGLVQPNGCFS